MCERVCSLSGYKSSGIICAFSGGRRQRCDCGDFVNFKDLSAWFYTRVFIGMSMCVVSVFILTRKDKNNTARHYATFTC
jgi:hypothetical protein